MKNLHDTIFPLYNKVIQRYSNFFFRSVLATSPLPSNPCAETILYTPLRKSDRRAYLLAAKSILRFCSPLRVIVHDDGSLDERSRRELNQHIPNLEIITIASTNKLLQEKAHPDLFKYLPTILSDELPTNLKILKLKLLNILYRFPQKKIIMIDSDIICLRPPYFIMEWMRDPIPSYFYGGGGNNQKDDFHALGFDFRYVDIADFNSGVMGIFNEIHENDLLSALRRIYENNPALFLGWEIEQSLWAVLLGSKKESVNIDHIGNGYIKSGWKTYQFIKENAIIAHFVGAIRFKNFRYFRLASDIYKELQ